MVSCVLSPNVQPVCRCGDDRGRQTEVRGLDRLPELRAKPKRLPTRNEPLSTPLTTSENVQLQWATTFSQHFVRAKRKGTEMKMKIGWEKRDNL